MCEAAHPLTVSRICFKGCLQERRVQQPDDSVARKKGSTKPACPHWGGSCGSSKGRCLIKVLQLGRGICSLNFRIKGRLLKCWSALRLRRLSQSGNLGSGLRHFSFKFPHQAALLTCPSALRLGSLAQSVRLGSGLGDFTWTVPRKAALFGSGLGDFSWNFHAKWLFWDVRVSFHCAGLRKVCS